MLWLSVFPVLAGVWLPISNLIEKMWPKVEISIGRDHKSDAVKKRNIYIYITSIWIVPIVVNMISGLV